MTNPVTTKSADYVPSLGIDAPPARGSKISGDDVVPPPPGTKAISALTLPMLLAPLKHGGLGLEQLVQALGLQTRQVYTKSGLETLKANAAEREENSKKQIESLQQQLKTLKKQEKLGPFMKALKWIGHILGAVAAVTSIAIGAITCNPLLVAAGAVMAVMTVNGIVTDATDGKHGIGAWVAKGMEALGVDEKAAKWIGVGCEMLIMLAGVILSFGSGSAAAMSKVAETSSTVMTILSKASSATNILASLNAMGSGAAGIANSIFEYDITNAKADQKFFQAILERLQMLLETETDFIENLMKRSEEMLADVKDVVEGNNQTQTAVLTAQAPSMA